MAYSEFIKEVWLGMFFIEAIFNLNFTAKKITLDSYKGQQQ